MKVLFTIHGFPPYELGGSEIYAFSLAKTLRKHGIDVTVFARSVNFDKDSYSLLEEEIDGIKVKRIVNNLTDIHTFTDHFINKKIRDLFLSVLLQEKPDIVHFQHLIFLSGDLPSVVKSYGIPNITMLHDYWYFCMRVNLFKPDHTRCSGPNEGLNCVTCFNNVTPAHLNIPRLRLIDKLYGLEKLRLFLKKIIPHRFKSTMKSIIFKKQLSSLPSDSAGDINRLQEFSFRTEFLKKQLSNCDCIISPSRHLQMRYIEQGFGNVNFIPLGIDPMPDVNKKSRDSIIRFGFVGNITPTKGFAVLLRELQLLKTWENIEVHVFGQVYDENYFKKEFSCVTSEYLNKIRFHGRFERDDQSLKKVYENMDVLIFPSICEENSPLVVRESLMTGTPVIASNLGGIPEIIEEGVNGLLFDPDSIGDLAKKITGLIESRHLLFDLTKGAKKTAVLDINKHAEKIINLYTDLHKDHFEKKQKTLS